MKGPMIRAAECYLSAPRALGSVCVHACVVSLERSSQSALDCRITDTKGLWQPHVGKNVQVLLVILTTLCPLLLPHAQFIPSES